MVEVMTNDFDYNKSTFLSFIYWFDESNAEQQ